MTTHKDFAAVGVRQDYVGIESLARGKVYRPVHGEDLR